MASLQEIYNKKTLLLTGTTGFLGKVLLQKLLFSQPTISRIYLLIRGKKGLKLQERFQKEILDSPCFDRLRKKYGNKFNQFINQKIKLIQGDMLKDRLGMTQQDEKELIQNVNFIMNCAASIDFKERLDSAININIKGTLKMLDLAKKIKNLNNFTHVSTCYVNCTQKQKPIKQKIYIENTDPQKQLKYLDSLSLNDLVNRSDQIIGQFPNTYTFTKNLCERLLLKRKENISLTILRPAIIINSYEEPYQGWVDSLAAAVAFFFFSGLGIVKDIYGNTKLILDLINVDTVSNYIIVGSAFNSNSNKIEVFHSSSSQRNPIFWKQVKDEIQNYWNSNKSSERFSKSEFEINNKKFFFDFNRSRRKFPAVVYNRIANIFGSKQHIQLSQRKLKTLKKGYEVERVFRYFIQQQFIFEASNVDRLTNWMCEQDRQNFNIDPIKFDTNRNLRLSNYGIQKFILKQDVQLSSVQQTSLFNSGKTYLSDLKWAFKEAGNSISNNSNNFNYNLKQEILRSSRVQQAIHKNSLDKNPFQNLNSKQFKTNIKNTQKMADQIINQMFGTFSMPVVRLQAWILTKFLKAIYEKIIVNESIFQKLKQIQNKMKIPIILISTHKSYTDFIILTYLFFNYKLKIPYVACNEILLKMALIPHLLRSSRAFFIKNKQMKKNNLYRAILEEFIIRILYNGNNMSFSLESSRSRTGKILDVDFDILEIIVNSVLDQHVNDVCIMPVTINYEKVLEGDTFPEELLGEEKVQQSLIRIAKTYKLLKTNFGKVYVEFSDPIFLKEIIKNQSKTTPNSIKNITDRKKIVNELGYNIIHKLTDSLVIMSTSIVSTAILLNRKGVTEDLLIKNVHWICKQVSNRGYKIGGINQISPDVSVRNCIAHLNQISRSNKIVFEVQTSSRQEYKKFLFLSYYRNMLAHVFLPETFIGVAQYSFGKQLSQYQGVAKQSLQERTLFLTKLLQKQFITKTQIKTSLDFNSILQNLLDKRIFIQNNANKIIIPQQSQQIIFLYCSLIQPLIQSYWVCILYFISMKNSYHQIHDVQLSRLKKYIQWHAESLYQQKLVQYYESCSLQTIKNAIKTFQSMKIISIKRNKKQQRVQLLANGQNLMELQNLLKSFLKNGKYASSSDLARISISGNLLSRSKL